MDTFFEAQRGGSVVDILRGEAKMNELFVFVEVHPVEKFFDVVLHSFDVVVSDHLYFFHPVSIISAKLLIDSTQGCFFSFRKASQLW